MKRLIDFICALLLFLFFLPLMLLIGLAIKLTEGGSIFFIQIRPGLNGEPFCLYKFRTMADKRDEQGSLLADEDRLTRFGLLLRQFSLDELPQLWNVLKGELSLVGPRPLLMEYLPLYTKEQAQRHLVRPGMTGWAQINGRNAISWEEKFKLDVWYVQNQSFLLDIKILMLTLKKVIQSEGVRQPGNVTVETFKGSKSTLKEGHG
ncbi:sugar transferase [Bacillus sp. SD088]|uniref:sugar transferase n=1 Tax=Bacillus sp. SD088 TaxID=2782012 RepID=UPI001A96BB08|nr:sugar transferase [Bacillus sp. SD088]MBO0992537.1 sugar transferase [Bacillus sp. SD088]